jgi:predicted acyl esterase
MKKLCDCVVGDKIVVSEASWNDKTRKQTIHTVAKVNRVNLVASDGRLWNRDYGHEPGSEKLGGYVATAEAWDEDVHPFLVEFNLAQKLIENLSRLNQYRNRERAKLFVKALPHLQLAAKELGLE